MSRRAIVFDMDGVLIEGRGTETWINRAASAAALGSFGVEPDERLLDALESSVFTADMKAICETCGVESEAFWAAREVAASSIEHDRLRRGDRRPYEDVEVLFDLATDGPLGIVSNNRHETVSFVVDRFGFGDVVDAHRGRQPTLADLRRRKPHPHFVEETLEALGAADGIYVGDRRSDVLVARNAGLEAAFLRRPHNGDKPLPPGTTYELESLTDLLELVG